MQKIHGCPIPLLTAIFTGSTAGLRQLAVTAQQKVDPVALALETPNGDVLFSTERGYAPWYFLPCEGDTAFLMNMRVYSGGTGLTGDLNADTSHEKTAAFEYNTQTATGQLIVGAQALHLSTLSDADTNALSTKVMDGTITCVGQPEVRDIECAYRNGSEYLIVSRDNVTYAYETLRLFTGPLDALREVAIDRVDRYRDGGTTFYRTVEGTLYVPAPSKNQSPTWNNQVIQASPKDQIEQQIGNTYPRLKGIKAFVPAP